MNFSDPFWEKVNRDGKCWLWNSHRDPDGYGLYRPEGGKTRRAHRVAYELANGAIPDGALILHSCDTPSCVNPEHLKPGTHAENINDRDAKGRASPQHGEENNAAKVTWEDVCLIRALKAIGGMTQREIAKEFNIHEAEVSLIVNNKVWVKTTPAANATPKGQPLLF